MAGRLAVLLLILLLTSGDVERTGRVPTLAADDPIARAIERAAAYLDRRPLEHDEIWFVQQGSTLLGDAFTTWARSLVAAEPPYGAEHALAATRALRLPAIESLAAAPATSSTPSSPFLSSFAWSHQLFARLLVLAATCGPDAPALSEDLNRLVSVRTPGYVLAHQAWAVRIGAARRCLEPRVADRLRRAMARELLAELRGSNALTDLDIERAAVLCLLGAGHWVPDAWLAALLGEQDTAGGFGDRAGPQVPPGSLREEHSAALAFYLLAARLDAASSIDAVATP